MALNDQLIADVANLSQKLARPISSKDLLRHYKEFPDGRPLLLQRLGQLLLKLARSRVHALPRIHKFGIIGQMAFYAPLDVPEMRQAFTLYSAQVALTEQCKIRMPEHAISLLETRFEPMARNALAGYKQEWNPLLSQLKGNTGRIVEEMEGLLALARQYAAPKFIKAAPANLINRVDAADLLRKEYGRRSPGSETASMNVSRHLVHLAWPQSRLFPPLTDSYWADQVVTYCASRWPVTPSEHEFARGLSLVMIYGTGEE